MNKLLHLLYTILIISPFFQTNNTLEVEVEFTIIVFREVAIVEVFRSTRVNMKNKNNKIISIIIHIGVVPGGVIGVALVALVQTLVAKKR